MANGNSGKPPVIVPPKPPVIVPPKPPKPPKHYKLYTVRVYVIDGAYGGEMIDEFEFKAAHIRSFAGQYIREAEAEVQILLENIGKNGYTLVTPSGGKLYYPPHRIYYVEAEKAEENGD